MGKYREKRKSTNKKRKRIPGFFKVIFALILLFIVYKGIKFGCDKIASVRLDEASLTSPFLFINDDKQCYVMNDFDISDTISYKGKEYPVKWKSSSENAEIDEKNHVTVKRKKDESESVVFTETYKWGIGEAKKKYTVNIIKTGRINEYEQVDISTVIDGTYDKNMHLMADDNQNAIYMRGDFGHATVGSAEEAEIFVNSYKSVYGVDERVDFKVSDYDLACGMMKYQLQGYYNDYLVENANARLVVSEKKFEPFTLDINATTDFDNLCLDEIEYDITSLIDETYGKDNVVDLRLEDEKIINYNKLYQICYVTDYDYNTFKVYIACSDGTIEKVVNDSFYDENQPTKIKTYKENRDSKNSQYVLLTIFTNDSNGKYLINNDVVVKKGYETILGEQKESGNYSLKHNTSDAIAAESFDYINNANNYYKRQFDFDLKSYLPDNTIKVLAFYKDFVGIGDVICAQPCWVASENHFRVYPLAKEWEYNSVKMNSLYSFSSGPEVLAHEFTHAVFTYTNPCTCEEIMYPNETINGESFPSSIQMGAINEGYADVMGCLIAGFNSNEWRVGKNYWDKDNNKQYELRYYRDLIHYNGDSKHIVLEGKTQSEYYGDSNWNIQLTKERNYVLNNWDKGGDVHRLSVLVSHVGWEMFNNSIGFDQNNNPIPYTDPDYKDGKRDIFTKQDVANIWFLSLILGQSYKADSKIIDVYDRLIEAIEMLEYTSLSEKSGISDYSDPVWKNAAKKFIAESFKREKFDVDTYGIIYETVEIPELNEDGVPIDDEIRIYKVHYSPLGVLLLDKPVNIVVEDELSEADKKYLKETLELNLQKRIDEEIMKEQNSKNPDSDFIEWLKTLSINVEVESEEKRFLEAQRKIFNFTRENKELEDMTIEDWIQFLFFSNYYRESTMKDLIEYIYYSF